MSHLVNKPVQQVTPRLRELSLVNKPKLILSNRLLNQVVELHALVGDIEWSAVGLFEEVEGTISDLDNFTIKAHALYPMNVGSETYTEYEFGTQMIDIGEMYPEYEEGKYRVFQCHTHHSMQTFFSGTDTSELHENAPNHHYYLSLIVNHKSKYCAKIAYVADHVQDDAPEYINFKGTRIPLTSKKIDEKVLVVMDCDIEIEYGNGEEFSSRIQALIKEKEDRRARVVSVQKSTSNLNSLNKTPMTHKGAFEGFPFNQSWNKPEPVKSSKTIWEGWDDFELGSKYADADFSDIDERDIENLLIELISGDKYCPDDLLSLLDKVEKKPIKVNKKVFVHNFKRLCNDYFSLVEMEVVIDECMQYLRNFKEFKSAVKYSNLIDELYEEVK